MQQLDGKVAVITGGASGIGLAMAHRFGQAGMKLVLGDVQADALAAAETELGDAGYEVFGVECDVSDGDAVDALRDATIERFGAAHVVCNNAGVGSGGAMANLTTADWEWCLGVNLWGVIHGIRAFLPGLIAQGEGHVVNTASMAGMISPPFAAPYNASKFAVVAISESLYGEMALSKTGVGVSVLCPKWVKTRIHESERNRPEQMRNAEGRPDGSLGAMVAGLIETGMDPAAVAERVHDAVVDDRFYILTHDDSQAAIRQRMERILAGENPPNFFAS